jgi:hypothetical protein
MKNGVLLMPPHLGAVMDGYTFSKEIVSTAGLKDGDVLLVCGAESLRAARLAAMAVALDLI